MGRLANWQQREYTPYINDPDFFDVLHDESSNNYRTCGVCVRGSVSRDSREKGWQH